MLDKIKWKIHWNKKTILKGTAIAAVPLLGVSAFLGFWFMQPAESVDPGPIPTNEFVIESTSWYSNTQIYVDYKYTGEVDDVDQVVVEYGYDGIFTTSDISTEDENSYFILNDAPQGTDVTVDVTVQYTDDTWEEEPTEYLNWEDNPGYSVPKPDPDYPEHIPANPITPSNPEDPGYIVPPVQEIYAFEITDVYWFSNTQIYLDYQFTSNPAYVDQVIVEYGYDGVFTTEELTTDSESSYFILNGVPQESDIDINVRIEYINGHVEYEETQYVLWEDNPGYYTPKPDDPDFVPGNPITPSDPEDPVGIKDPLAATPINPISTVDFYPATTSKGEFNQTYVETVLISNFDDMIDYSAPGISPDSEYDLYYELVDPYTLNVMIVETLDGQVLNETKFTYSIV